MAARSPPSADLWDLAGSHVQLQQQQQLMLWCWADINSRSLRQRSTAQRRYLNSKSAKFAPVALPPFFPPIYCYTYINPLTTKAFCMHACFQRHRPIATRLWSFSIHLLQHGLISKLAPSLNVLAMIYEVGIVCLLSTSYYIQTVTARLCRKQAWGSNMTVGDTAVNGLTCQLDLNTKLLRCISLI